MMKEPDISPQCSVYLHEVDRKEWDDFRMNCPKALKLGHAVSQLLAAVNRGEIRLVRIPRKE